MPWIYIDVDHLVPGTTAVSFPVHLQHVSYVATVLDHWHREQTRRLGAGAVAVSQGLGAVAPTSHADQCLESIALLKKATTLTQVAQHVLTKLREELTKDVTDSMDEGFAELAAPSGGAAAAPSSVVFENASSGASHSLSLVGLHKQVMTTAARLYIHQLMGHEQSVVVPWRAHLEKIRAHHLVEMDSLLVSTTTHLSPSTGGPGPQGRVVVNSSHLQSLVDRHSAELQHAEADLVARVQQSAAKARADFCSFLKIAATDVTKTLLTSSGGYGSGSNSPSQSPHLSPRSSPMMGGKREEDGNSIDSFFGVRLSSIEGQEEAAAGSDEITPFSSTNEGICAVEYRKVPNPYSGIQQGGQLKSKDPVISPILLGFSRFSDFLPCASLYTRTEDERGAKKVEAHFDRAASGRNGGVLFLGDSKSYKQLLERHDRQNLELILEHEEESFFLVRDRRVHRRNSTNMWCGTKQWFVDPSCSVLKNGTHRHGATSPTGVQGSRSSGVRSARFEEGEETDEDDGQGGRRANTDLHTAAANAEPHQNLPDDEAQIFYAELFSAILTDATSNNTDHLSIVLLPTGAASGHAAGGGGPHHRSYLFTPLLHGLVDAVAQAQLAMGGGRQAVSRALNPRILLPGATTISSSQLWWSCAPVLTNIREVLEPEEFALDSRSASPSQLGGGGQGDAMYYTKQQRHNFNTSTRIRLFVPDQAYHLVGNSVFSSSEKLSL